MLKILRLTVVAALLVALGSGCMMMSSSIPEISAVPMEEMKTTATYDIIGPAEGTSTGGYLFGFFAVKCENKSGAIGASVGLDRLYSPVQQAAVYNAIESVPTADALISPRFHTTVEKNFFLYREETVTVRGKAIRYNVSAK